MLGFHLEYYLRKVVFFDEFGTNFTMRRRFDRAPINETPRKSVKIIESKNFTDVIL